MARPFTANEFESCSVLPTRTQSNISSNDTCCCWAMACRDAVRKASGKNNPPNQRTYFCKLALRWSSRSWSNRLLKSPNHSVTVIVSCTAYCRHCFGTASVFMSSINCRTSLVVLTLPSHDSCNIARSNRTLLSNFLPWPISRSKQRHKGSFKLASVRSMSGTSSGKISIKPFTLSARDASGLVMPLILFFPPPGGFLATAASADCNASHLAKLCVARLILNICSACTGRPLQAGFPCASNSSIHLRNWSCFFASGACRSCCFDSVMFSLKSGSKLASVNRCPTKALRTSWSKALSMRPPYIASVSKDWMAPHGILSGPILDNLPFCDALSTHASIMSRAHTWSASLNSYFLDHPTGKNLKRSSTTACKNASKKCKRHRSTGARSDLSWVSTCAYDLCKEAFTPLGGSNTYTRESLIKLAGILGWNSIVRNKRKFWCGFIPYNFFSRSVSQLIAKCTFLSKTHVPPFEAAAMALSATAKPSLEPMAAEVRVRFVDAARSVTLPLGSKPGMLTIMMGADALLSVSMMLLRLKLGRSEKPLPSTASTNRTPM
mmetsp:Transcript_98082/g.299847  ORF Transcript_98082/g.299847 Transcript_98082/m.299847 type:complete len:550 (+) Transcript_98082:387-2036(+)